MNNFITDFFQILNCFCTRRFKKKFPWDSLLQYISCVDEYPTDTKNKYVVEKFPKMDILEFLPGTKINEHFC